MTAAFPREFARNVAFFFFSHGFRRRLGRRLFQPEAGHGARQRQRLHLQGARGQCRLLDQAGVLSRHLVHAHDRLVHVLQASGLQDVNQAIVRMDQVTRQNTSLVEEAALAARTLQMQALALSRTVAAFRLGEPEPAPQPERMAPAPNENGVPRDLPRERRRHERSHLRLASSRE